MLIMNRRLSTKQNNKIFKLFNIIFLLAPKIVFGKICNTFLKLENIFVFNSQLILRWFKDILIVFLLLVKLFLILSGVIILWCDCFNNNRGQILFYYILFFCPRLWKTQHPERMTMGDETPVSSLVLPVLLRPILSQVELLLCN